MKSPSLCALVAFVAFAAREIVAQDPREELGKLPVCAQACITSAFAACKCKILDFKCACSCEDFRSVSQDCTDTSCSGITISAVQNTLENTCRGVPALQTTLSFTSSRTSISTTKSSLSASTELLPSLSTTSPTGPSEMPMANPSAPPGGTDSRQGTRGPDETGTRYLSAETEISRPSWWFETTRTFNPTGLATLEQTSIFVKSLTGQGSDTPLTLTGPLFPITTITLPPMPSDCIVDGYGFWKTNGTRIYNGTGTGWNGTFLCTGYVRSSGFGLSGTGTPPNATATRTGFQAPWNSTSSRTSYSMPWYTGGVVVIRAQEASLVASGMLLVLGWVMT